MTSTTAIPPCACAQADCLDCSPDEPPPDTEPADDDNDCTACGGSGGGAAPIACPQCGGSGRRVQRTRARRSRDCEEP